ncbi:MAG: terpene cyclase/mutase family protein [Actinobacteria bacterium]|nr:terpene cyclase/mutase family protein [Actinomycetota bacterium]
MTLSTTRRVVAAGVVAAALAVPVLPSSAQAASSAPSAASRARTADGWLATRLVDGSHFEVTFGDLSFPDQGLTIDGILAFASGKVAEKQQKAATTWLTQPDILAGYVGDGTGESYSGAHAKAVLALQVRGKNPRKVAGRDLVAELKALQAPSGRFVDRSAFGDFSNAFGQSLGVVALKRAGSSIGAPARYLAGQACSDGGIPIQFEQITCTASVDATAIAVQALHAAGKKSAAHNAVAWLVAHQNADGGFGDGTTNANSTGLAAAALAIEGHDGAARRARAAIGTLQQGCTAAPADRGAIALDSTGFDPDTAIRATTQAVLGLAGTDLNTLTAKRSSNALPAPTCPAGTL